MAITATIAVSNSSVSANESIDVTVEVTNGGVASVNVEAVQMTMTPNPSVIGQPAVSIMAPVTIAASAKAYFPVSAVGFAPQRPGDPMIQYTISAIVYLTDGTGTSATSATVFTSPPDAVMPTVGQVRLDSNLNSFYLLLLAI
jgi:hypothetical protein